MFSLLKLCLTVYWSSKTVIIFNRLVNSYFYASNLGLVALLCLYFNDHYIYIPISIQYNLYSYVGIQNICISYDMNFKVKYIYLKFTRIPMLGNEDLWVSEYCVSVITWILDNKGRGLSGVPLKKLFIDIMREGRVTL